MSEKKLEKKQECVQVVVRCRPFSTKESNENRSSIIATETALFQISLSNPSRPGQAPKNFTFDAVYDETTQQKAFYEESCYDLVEGVMEGYNGTIFAYGQTGCGKTHTMQGYNDPPELRGVIPHSFDHIFENITGSVNTAFLVRCCYLEIYNEEVRDLLVTSGEKKDKLELKEDPNKGVYIKDLSQAIVSNQEGINRLMERGQKMRTVGATAMNATSSRSHSIFTIVVEINDVDEAGKDHIRVGKLNLVDLAGSERASKTGATGDRLKEGCKINLSLSALGNVISALVDGKGKHIPYRDSKLTRLLQDSLGGNTKTLMVAAISPADYNYEETLSTLRYANRAKNIKNKPTINEDPKDAMLRQYKEEIEKLKEQLVQASQMAMGRGGTGGGDGDDDAATNNTNPSEPSAAELGLSATPPLGVAEASLPPCAILDASRGQKNNIFPGPISADDRAAAATRHLDDKHQDGKEGLEDGTKNNCHGSTNDVAREEAYGAGKSAAVPAGVVATEAGEGNEEAPSEAIEQTDSSSEYKKSVSLGVEESLAGRGDAIATVAAAGGEPDRTSGGGGGSAMGGGVEGKDRGIREDAAVPQTSGGGAVSPATIPEVVIREKIVEKVVIEEKVVVREIEVEVESQKMAHHRKALENYSKAVEEQRNRLGQELESSVIRADVERHEREEMARKLESLQKKVIGMSSSAAEDRRRLRKASVAMGSGGGTRSGDGKGTDAEFSNAPETESPEVIIARENAQHRRMQAKLRQKRRKEARLELERMRALEEKAEVEKEMADVVEQAEEKERRLNKSRKKLERKLVEAREEIEDLTMEHEREREELLDSIRNQNKELQLWEQVARQILPSKEIARIWERGEYDEDEQAWVLPRIKPRASYFSEPCKLPLLAPPGSAPSGSVRGGIDDDMGQSGGRKDRKRGGGGRSAGSEVRGSVCGSALDAVSGGVRVPISGKAGRLDGGGGGEEGRGKRRSIAGSGRSGNEDRPPRREEEVAPKEGGGGILHDADKPWETFAGRESGGLRGKGGAAPVIAGLLDVPDSPREDRYKGLTPPISPAQGRAVSPSPGQSAQGVFGQGQKQLRPRSHRGRGSAAETSETTSRQDSSLSSAAGSWGFSGDVEGGSRGGGGQGGDFDQSRGSGRTDRCPSRQGGARTGARTASGNKPGQEQRQQQLPSSTGLGYDRPFAHEDSLLSQSPNNTYLRSSGYTRGLGSSGCERTDAALGPANSETPGGMAGGSSNKARSRSQKKKTRTSMGGRPGEGQEEYGVMAEWGNGSNEQQWARGGGSKKERRSKMLRRGDGSEVRMEAGAGVEGGVAGQPSFLESRIWNEGRGEGVVGDGGNSPGSVGDLYDFGE